MRFVHKNTVEQEYKKDGDLKLVVYTMHQPNGLWVTSGLSACNSYLVDNGFTG